MVNEFVYCPRLFHLMHVEGRWAENSFTIDGRTVHRRVDRIDHVLPDPATTDIATADRSDEAEGDEIPCISRSVSLSDDELGITAKLDLVSTSGDEAVPVETKRGRVPDRPERSYEPERVQLMAQGLLLRRHGYRSDHGYLYFAGSKTRVEIEFSDELESKTRLWIDRARAAARSTVLPPPLDDSPKCNGCSLAPICLPDETLAARALADEPTVERGTPRRLYPARDEAVPLYVQDQGTTVGKSGQSLVVRHKKVEIGRYRLIDVSQLVVCGGVHVTAQTMHTLCEAGIPVVHMSRGHWFYGITHGINLRNAYDRAAQFSAAENPARRLTFARSIVAAKVNNQRTMLRRNAPTTPSRTREELAQILRKVARADSVESLLGYEGNAAALYFANFERMLNPRDMPSEWAFEHRNRRPPQDPVNAMLSFGYALLAKEFTVAILAEGLDPWWGLYHRPRHGRPALALDLMEDMRPLVVDSAVLFAVNTGMVSTNDFVSSQAGCAMKPTGRKALIRAYETRISALVTHPQFGYKCSWRSIVRLQVRLFARWLRGDIPTYNGMTTR